MSHGDLSILKGTQIFGARIGLCGKNIDVDVDSLIDTSYMGCGPGEGAGSFSQTSIFVDCGLPGASYGDFGGRGAVLSKHDDP